MTTPIISLAAYRHARGSDARAIRKELRRAAGIDGTCPACGGLICEHTDEQIDGCAVVREVR